MRRVLCVALICAPSLAHAQDLNAALADTFAPLNHVENLANTLSCTALYRSLSLMFGTESDLEEGLRNREGFMATVAGVLWTAQEAVVGQTPDDVFATTSVGVRL